MTLSKADVAYITANYATLEELCGDGTPTPEEIRELIADGRLPQPSYVLEDGTVGSTSTGTAISAASTEHACAR